MALSNQKFKINLEILSQRSIQNNLEISKNDYAFTKLVIKSIFRIMCCNKIYVNSTVSAILCVYVEFWKK